MDLSNYFQLGKIIRSHGVKGDLVIFLDVDDPSAYKKLKSVFYKEADELKELQITSIRINAQLATVHCTGIEDRNTSNLYIKKEVLLPIDKLPKLKDDRFYFHEIIGFRLMDKNLGDLGPISNVYEMPQHPILAIIYKEREVLIPAVKDFIIEVDRNNQVIKMELPDGLIDVYLA